MKAGVANDPALVGKLVTVFERTATPELISNLTARVDAYQNGDTAYPVTVSDGPNCYLCSPTVAYVDYAVEETRNFEFQPVLKKVLVGLIRACAPLVRATSLDRQVQPNNWLFSTNPVPVMTSGEAGQMRDNLTGRYPDRAIVIRSLNDLVDLQTISALKTAGFVMLPARQIYLFDGRADAPLRGDQKRDQKALAHTLYTVVEADTFSADDFTRAARLYAMLYVDKYTALNPQYTPSYLAQAHQIGLLRIVGLRGSDDQLDAVLGFFENGQTLTVPIVGYDTSKPQSLGLYRLVNAIAQQHATTEGKFYNMSAGAAQFKRNRGAVPAIEYTAVYVAHLSVGNRIATRIVKTLLDWIGIPLLRRFAL